jgi:uncharacterized protein
MCCRRKLILAGALASLAAANIATAATTPAAYPPLRTSAVAPWWMGQPIIASLGSVRAEVPSNRAEFSASFEVLKSDVGEATRLAAAKVKAVAAAFAAFGPDKARISTTFSMRPIYDQYRDKQGNLLENRRPDKIETYAVTANVQIEVRDMRLLERAYATVLAAHPSSSGAVNFRLEPDNAAKTELFQAAIADAARRARLAVEATGAHLGAVKLIDPTGRACESDVLVAGAPAGGYDDLEPEAVSLRAAGIQPRPPVDIPNAPPSPAIALEKPARLDGPLIEAGQTLRPEDMQLPLQPPLQWLEKKACVVYALGG